uniref:LOB domain-containing protein 30-like n=1 Tax=Erigeron canadensis TaxID=72917 RepID=UPI001CB8FA93|nr:LOB domain-containing protein 30-like [Erigeron canadensis]
MSSANYNPPGSSTSSGGGPCGACKFLRRKCVQGCIFAPYFDSEQGATRFAAVHKVFGASNVSKLLLHIPVHKRLDAVVSICYEAQARLRDPVYGCVAHLFSLQQQVASLQTELSYLQAHLATLEVPLPPPPQLPPAPAGFSIGNLPITSSCSSMTYDLSVLFDPTLQASSTWSMHGSATDVLDAHNHFSPVGTTSAQQRGDSGNVGDLLELAKELSQRQSSGTSEVSTLPPQCSR